MKRTQWIDVLRLIRKQLISFLSIVVIAMLAVTAFYGIKTGSDSIRQNSDRFFSAQNFRDFEIVSTMLFSQDDIAAIRALDGVYDVEPVRYMNGLANANGSRYDLSVITLTERINRVRLIEGRMPETATECLLESDLQEQTRLSVGDTIRVLGTNGKEPQNLKHAEFTIVGVAYHPDHFAHPAQVAGNRYVIVLPDAFDASKMNDCYSRVFVTLEKPDGIDLISAEYKEISARQKSALQALAEQRAPIQEAAFIAFMTQQFDDSQAKLDDAAAEIENGKAQIEEGRKKLADGDVKLADGKAELEESRQKLEDGRAKLTDGKRELEDSWKQLEEGKAKLEENRQKLADGKAQLDRGRASLNRAKRQLDDGKQQLAEAFATVESMKQSFREIARTAVENLFDADTANAIAWAGENTEFDIDDPNLSIMTFSLTSDFSIRIDEIPDTILDSGAHYLAAFLSDPGATDQEIAELASSIRSSEEAQYVQDLLQRITEKLGQWDEKHAEYLNGLRQYRSGESQFREKYAEYEAGKAEFDAGEQDYLDGLAKYEAGKAEYESRIPELVDGERKYAEGLQKYNDGVADAEKGRADLEAAIEKLEKGKREYADGCADLQSARDVFAAIGHCNWILQATNDNGGWVHSDISASNISRLGIVFAAQFVVVGALVIYASIGRMVQGQRKLIGTGRALGLYRHEIFRKYLFFGISAAGIGALLGIALGSFLIQRIAATAHINYYVNQEYPFIFDPLMAVILIIGAAVVASVSVWFASRPLLRESAQSLMQDPVDTSRRKSAVTRLLLPLRSRMILRNMISDWKRILITSISIAGCTMLLLIGFTLRSGVETAINRQFDRVIRYGSILKYDPSIDKDCVTDAEDVLNRNGVAYTPVTHGLRTYNSNGTYSSATILVGHAQTLTQYFSLQDLHGTPIALPDDGAAITSRMSEVLNAGIGDSLTIYDANMNPHSAQVSAIFENYIGNYICFSPAAYQSTFGTEAEPNAFLLKDRKLADSLRTQLESIDGFKECTDVAAAKDNLARYSAILTMVTLMLIIMAGLMTYFILLNLIGMYLSKKKRELVIMRVNGFTTKEVIRYVIGDSIVTTILGTAIGLLLGAWNAYVIVRFLEQPHVMFVRTPDRLGMLFSVLITFVFSAGIHAIALRSVSRLKLTDL